MNYLHSKDGKRMRRGSNQNNGRCSKINESYAKLSLLPMEKTNLF